MSTRARAAAVALALLLVPNVALADNARTSCGEFSMQQDDECNGKREKPKFQTKFFSE